jgi:3-methylfumaryl-CoA hydratase
MWAGGRLRFRGELRLGQPAVRRTALLACERKSGRSGALLIVTLEHRMEQAGATVIIEEQDLVYRAPGPPVAVPAGTHRPDMPDGGWVQARQTGAAMLFRFSAVTFNSHRIHYDRPYATEVEGYPALVVHGPLIALSLAEFVREKTSRALQSFDFRASAPLFADLPWHIVAQPDGDQVGVTAVRNDGQTAMTATAGTGG